jgi:two-component system OmpR family sensor kinase
VTLRARLLIGYAVVLVMIVAGALAVVRIQESYLIELLDRQLQNAIGPVMRGPARIPPPPTGTDPQSGPLIEDSDSPVSDLYLARVVDGEVRPVIVGLLLDDRPAISAAEALVATTNGGRAITLPGVDGVNRFRAQVVRPADATEPIIVALPMTIVDDAVDRLTITLVAGIALIAAVLGLIVFWVEMLGVRPIRRLTRTADAIGRGERDLRADDAGDRTEAAHLARAFNLMLDERDEGEERLRRFVADASHELRTPLTSIRGYVDLLREGGEEPAERADMLRRMAGETGRMTDLVEDLLLLARLDEHRPLREEPVDLRALLEDAALDARVLQPDRPVSLDIPGEEPLLIAGDAFRLQQVVAALVHNALVHTEPDAPIELGAWLSADAATIVVSDGGAGMDAETAEHAFDRFVRGDGSRSRESGGAGLGLAIARAVVEAHGGSIALDTAPGQGARFEIRLPR